MVIVAFWTTFRRNLSFDFVNDGKAVSSEFSTMMPFNLVVRAGRLSPK